MIITKEIAGGFVFLAENVSNFFKINFSPDSELLNVQIMINNIQGGLNKIKFWIEKKEDVKEEEFITYVNMFSGRIGMLLLEIGYMKEEKKITSRLARNKKLVDTSKKTGIKRPFFLKEKTELVKQPNVGSLTDIIEMKLDMAISDFSYYDTRLEVFRCSLPDIKSSIPFFYKGEMRIKELSDFHVPNFVALAMQDPVEFGNRESIPPAVAQGLVAYANIKTIRSEIGTSNGMPPKKGFL
jgi:hypothetical protein